MSDTFSGHTPRAWLDGCIAAHRRLEAVAGRITDGMARGPTRLEGWTVGHLLTHLARNADSHRGMVEAAQRDTAVYQYPGGRAQRDAAIEAGHGRSAVELIDDLKEAVRRLEEAWAATAEEVWATGLGLVRAGPVTIADGVWLRWREVEIHLVDLGLRELGSPDWNGLSAAYVDREWQEILARLQRRVPEGMTLVLVPDDRPSRAFGSGDERAIVRAAPARILAWLMGRGGEPDWPVLTPWE